MNAVITGASRGIGKAYAEIFALHGYNLYLNSKTEYHLLETISQLKAAYPNVHIDGKALNVGLKAEADLFGEWVKQQADTVDVLINNAGSYVPGNVHDEADGALESMLENNLYSAYHTTRAILPKMKSQGFGHIFNMASIAGLDAYPGGGSYSISKYAVMGFTKNLRSELKHLGIKVTAVIPGAVYTDSWKGSGVEEARIMRSDDLAKMVFAAAQLSPQAVVEDIVLRPQKGDL